jgi:hypothetical protein
MLNDAAAVLLKNLQVFMLVTYTVIQKENSDNRLANKEDHILQ